MWGANINRLYSVHAVAFIPGNNRVFIEGVPPPVQTSLWFPVLWTGPGTKRPVSSSGSKGQPDPGRLLWDTGQNSRCHARVPCLLTAPRHVLRVRGGQSYSLRMALQFMCSLRCIYIANRCRRIQFPRGHIIFSWLADIWHSTESDQSS